MKRAISPDVSDAPATSKVIRVDVDDHLASPQSHTSASLICTLPPSCNGASHRATVLSSTKEMDRHYALYHTNVCLAEGCRCVFPDERFLELHQLECHDPMIALRRERGERTFTCFLSSCNRQFRTPKGRRLHLIDNHGYSKQFFFAITTNGISGLIKRFGEGASLILPEWKAEYEKEESSNLKTDNEGFGDHETSLKISSNSVRDPPPHLAPSTSFKSGPSQRPVPSSTHLSSNTPIPDSDSTTTPSESAPDTSSIDPLESLTSNLSSLSLVPSSIRFGRGAKRGGFVRPLHYKTSKTPSQGTTIPRATDAAPPEADGMQVDGIKE